MQHHAGLRISVRPRKKQWNVAEAWMRLFRRISAPQQNSFPPEDSSGVAPLYSANFGHVLKQKLFRTKTKGYDPTRVLLAFGPEPAETVETM
ncbi:MAG: hypothetical protein ACR2JB_25650 [Bryobacteraceae bacterium]